MRFSFRSARRLLRQAELVDVDHPLGPPGFVARQADGEAEQAVGESSPAAERVGDRARPEEVLEQQRVAAAVGAFVLVDLDLARHLPVALYEQARAGGARVRLLRGAGRRARID